MDGPATPGEPLITVRQLKRGYRMGRSSVHALDGIDLRIARGAFLGIVGRSGSGKSTLLNILGGLDRPEEGQVLVDGEELGKKSQDGLSQYRREKVGFIFQSFHLLPALTALQNVSLPLVISGRKAVERDARARALLERVGLGERLDHRPTELSGGEQQRVAIARALVTEPILLLADEPTGNLDSHTADEIAALLQEMNRERGQTIVMVTHERALACRCCTEVVELNDGRVIRDEVRGALPASAAGEGTA